jgi:hypothetical protein
MVVRLMVMMNRIERAIGKREQHSLLGYVKKLQVDVCELFLHPSLLAW